MRIQNIIAISFIALTVLTLQGCGRKGALFMEAPKAAPMVKPQVVQPVAVPAQSQPVPAPTLQSQPETKK
jgi:predicted small lipoprotein YifL